MSSRRSLQTLTFVLLVSVLTSIFGLSGSAQAAPMTTEVPSVAAYSTQLDGGSFGSSANAFLPRSPAPAVSASNEVAIDSSVVLGAPADENRQVISRDGVMVYADTGEPFLAPDGSGRATCDPSIIEQSLDDESIDLQAYATERNCYLPPEIVNYATGLQNCGPDDIGNLFSEECLVDPIVDAATNALEGIFEPVIESINEAFRGAFLWGIEWLFGNVLGGSGQATADNDFQRGFAAPNLNTNWFSSQMDLTRQIALYLIAPLFMLAIIQSILKGSLFFLLRAGLIMLPISILGSVVVVEFARRLLWISDDFSHFIAATAISDSNTWLQQSVDSYAGTAFGLFELLFMVVGAFAFLVIYAELIIRELGVYLAVFFMPLGFAALVWPATAKFARRLVELLIGLIFSKVFIVAVLSMGVAAFGSVDQQISNGTASVGGDITGLTAAVAIFFMAAFAGAKVIDISSASSAAEGRLTQPGNIWNKGQVANYALGQMKNRADKKAANNTPSGSQVQRGPRADSPSDGGDKASALPTSSSRPGNDKTNDAAKLKTESSGASWGVRPDTDAQTAQNQASPSKNEAKKDFKPSPYRPSGGAGKGNSGAPNPQATRSPAQRQQPPGDQPKPPSPPNP